MGVSYQDIDTRLVGVENALAFLMRSLRVKEMISSPLDPKPLVRETDMLTYYQEQLSKGLLELMKDKDGTDDEPVASTAAGE